MTAALRVISTDQQTANTEIGRTQSMLSNQSDELQYIRDQFPVVIGGLKNQADAETERFNELKQQHANTQEDIAEVKQSLDEMTGLAETVEGIASNVGNLLDRSGSLEGLVREGMNANSQYAENAHMTMANLSVRLSNLSDSESQRHNEIMDSLAGVGGGGGTDMAETNAALWLIQGNTQELANSAYFTQQSYYKLDSMKSIMSGLENPILDSTYAITNDLIPDMKAMKEKLYGTLEVTDTGSYERLDQLIQKVQDVKDELNNGELLAEVKDMNLSQKDSFVRIIEKIVPPLDSETHERLDTVNNTLIDIKDALTSEGEAGEGDGSDIDASEEIKAIRKAIDSCFKNYILTEYETTLPQHPDLSRCTFAESIQRNLMVVNSTLAGQNDLLDRVSNSTDEQTLMMAEVVRSVRGIVTEDDELIAQLEQLNRNGGDNTQLLSDIKDVLSEMSGGPVVGEVSLTPEAQQSLNTIGSNTAATNSQLGGIGQTLDGIGDDIDSIGRSLKPGSGQNTGPATCQGKDCWKAASWIESSYPDGVAGVWEERKDAFDRSGMKQYLNSLIPQIGGNGGLKPFELCFDMGFAHYGCHSFTIPPYVIAFIRLCFLIAAGFYCQRLVFGGA